MTEIINRSRTSLRTIRRASFNLDLKVNLPDAKYSLVTGNTIQAKTSVLQNKNSQRVSISLLSISSSLELENEISKIQPNFIINCIGILIEGCEKFPDKAVRLNSELPLKLERTAKKNPIAKHAVALRNHKLASTVKNLANRRVVRKKLRSVTKKLKPKKVKKIIKEKSVLVGGQKGGSYCGQQPDGATGGTTEFASFP